MVSQGSWCDTLVCHLEASWMDLVNLTANCAEENLVDGALVEYEVRSLRDKIMRAKDQQDATELERLAHEANNLLSYYKALRRHQFLLEEAKGVKRTGGLKV